MRPVIKPKLLLTVVLLVLLTTPANASPILLPGSTQAIERNWDQRWRQGSQLVPQYINRLVLADSAYLKQHADNPIDWYPWAEVAFERALKENKLIFLSIGYASCHWCHVMETESFSDTEVAVALNQAFVSIKVDREQQPDIDAYYNLAVETIKGESGWPITMVLLPDRKPVLAANYLSKTQLLTVTARLNRLWQDQPEVLKQNADLLAGEIEQRLTIRNSGDSASKKQWLEQARQKLLSSIDPLHGGFGVRNKFPSELKLQFLLNRYKFEQTAELKQTLIDQLNAVMNSGMSDVIFGGVFRYTTDRQMTRPHFEKMLYNQALIVSLYTDAAVWLEKPVYREYADSIIDFVKKYMRLPGGTYAAAIDADHDGREGGFYLWAENVMNNLPSAIKTVAYADKLYYLYGSLPMTGQGSWQSNMQQKRMQLPGTTSPRVIDNQITAWNALWLLALLQAQDLDAAIDLADIIWTTSWSKGQLFRLGNQPGFLDDYSYFSNALWQLYLKTEDFKWKRRARLLDSTILKLFYKDGSLSYRSRDDLDQYPIDLHQDSELPSPLATTLKSFANHQTELGFIKAYEKLKAGSNAAVDNQPEYYLALLQLEDKAYAVSETIIAKGNGMVSLRSTTVAGHWQVIVNLDDNWHINASKVTDKRLIATRVEGVGDLKVNYPAGIPLIADFSKETLNVYSGRVVIDITVAIGQQPSSLQILLQACSKHVCLLPEKVLLLGLP